MRIAVNTRLLLKGKLEGIGWFAHELLSRLVVNHPEDEFIFLFDRPWDESFIYGKNVTPVVIGPQARHPILYYIWTEFSVPRALKKYKPDLYFSPDLLGSLRAKIPVVFTIHDLAYKHFPQFIPKKELWYNRHFTPLFAQKAKRVIAVSQYTKKDIVEQLHLSEEKITVVYNGADKAYQPLDFDETEAIREELTEGEEYFLYVGALHPRKNIINLLKAFVQFKRRQHSPMKLVMVGRFAWLSDEIKDAKERMPFKKDVIWLGYVDVARLAKIMGSAYALVYPSWFEGFGIPVLEAMCCNVPVLVANASSLPEVAGKAGILMDPASPDDMGAKMGLIYKDENLRDHLIKNGKEQRKQFDWDVSAQKLWQVFKDIVG